MFSQKVLLSAFALTVGVAATASADILVVNPPTDDGTLRAVGSSSTGLTLVGDTGPTDFLRGVYAFDLSAPELVGATINSVTLTLTAHDTDGSSVDATSTIDLHQLSAALSSNTTWTESDSSVPTLWTSPGGDFGGVLASESGNASTVVSGDTFNFSGAGLTSATAGSLGGSLDLIAKLATEGGVRNVFRFSSSEQNNGEGTIPTLTIDYTPVPEPGSLALLGLGGLLIARRRRG